MTDTTISPDSLVLYKQRPARVLTCGERLEIELDDNNRVKVRSKDIYLLHPGPVRNLSLLEVTDASNDADAVLAWEILRDSETSCTLAELAELALSEYTPQTAWKVWGWVVDGLYFHGTPDNISARPEEVVRRDLSTRQARREEQAVRQEFLRRAAAGTVTRETDTRFLREIEDLALGRRSDSRLLRELGRSERAENAHALLMEWGVWGVQNDPYPVRLGLELTPPSSPLLPMLDEPRLDLTGFQAFAIDDRGNQDPDDAVSLVEVLIDPSGRFAGGKLWVHIADVAARVPPDSTADLEARSRAATLYLPEGAVQMLPIEAVTSLGLGLQSPSPALSFAVTLNAAAEITEVQVHPSWVQVQRSSYEKVEDEIEAEPFRSLLICAQAYASRRQANGAFLIDMPETVIKVDAGRVTIEPLRRMRSRDLVREAMLMCGEAVAILAKQQSIPIPFVVQESAPLAAQKTGSHPASFGSGEGTSYAAMFAQRRMLRRSQVRAHPAPHSGVGLPVYCRTTSPLRRYLDLVVHQQLRLWLRGQPPLAEAALFERLGNHDAQTGAIIQAESLARRHWTLVYLMQNPDWCGEGVLVDSTGGRVLALVPDLALEAPVMLRQDLPLDSRLTLAVRNINLPELEITFKVV